MDSDLDPVSRYAFTVYSHDQDYYDDEYTGGDDDDADDAVDAAEATDESSVASAASTASSASSSSPPAESGNLSNFPIVEELTGTQVLVELGKEFSNPIITQIVQYNFLEKNENMFEVDGSMIDGWPCGNNKDNLGSCISVYNHVFVFPLLAARHFQASAISDSTQLLRLLYPGNRRRICLRESCPTRASVLRDYY
ncbi:hypothetical protein LXL04_033703 [Taraxacum kok-saghyz]